VTSDSQSYPGERLGVPESGPGSIGRLGRRVGALFVDYGAAYLISGFFAWDPLAILAILLTGEFSRRGQGKRIFGAMMLLSLLEAATLGLSDAAMRGWWGAIAMYAVPLLTAACALMVLMGRPKRLFQRSAPPHMPDDNQLPPTPGGGPFQTELPPSGLGSRPAYLNPVR